MTTHATFQRLGLELQEIAEQHWRVCDLTVSRTGAPPVRGYVRALDGMYEVTRFGQPGRRSYFRSLDAALRDLSPSRR
ncbi:hypothetical protein [Leifsonia sp. NPDC080035]|uniref:Uncharacterized protein n=1 Tax=Leifsonia sp. NPDC080035 TaxID=3143936 RepID=A0AAU7GA40_9MICO